MEQYYNLFIGRKFVGRELNKAITNTKFRFRELDKTIDNIENLIDYVNVITFDDTNSIYIGYFLPILDKEKSLEEIINSKEYKQAVKMIQSDFEKITIPFENIINERSENLH